MLDPQMVFIGGMFTTILVASGYSVGVVTQRTLAIVGAPAICSALAATIMIGMAPPPPPLSPAEQRAKDDGYVLGLATGMLMPR
jgi:hypothetical protein